MPFIDINSLFVPATSGISLTSPGATPPTGTWLSQMLANAVTLQLQTSSWQVGGVARTIFAITSQLFAQADSAVSIMAQGGFLDFAASGTVSSTAVNGVTVVQPVSPDPSVAGQNPNGVVTWLDVLSDSVYNVQRIGAQQAPGSIAIANSTTNTYGPYAAGTYHVGNPTSGAGYSNVASLTISASQFVGGSVSFASNTGPITITTASAHGLTSSNVVQIAGVLGNTAANGMWTITVLTTTSFLLNGSNGSGAYTSGGTTNVCTVAAFVADLAGPGGTSAPSAITQATSVLSGVAVSNPAAFFGQGYESNVSVAARCRLKIQSLAPNGAAGAYKYFALTASQILAAQTPAVILSAPITRVLVSALAGVVTTTIANAAGPVTGVSNLGITAAAGTPIAITTATPHGLSTGAYVTLYGVLGDTNANGTFVIASTGASTFTLNGTTSNATYTGGGVVEGGDLGEVDAVLQSNCVPTGKVAITQAATSFPVAVVGSVIVPLAQVNTYQTAVQVALVNYFAGLAIGGNAGTFSYNDIIGVMHQAGSVNGAPSYVVTSSNITINGGAVDLTYPGSTYVATLASTLITVTGI